ncbi:MAG: ribonuclease H [Actinomycetota bacterium]|nr:ribonuclease H [Actinomycetota bacterium]
MPDFACRECGTSFSLSQAVLDRFPGWSPKQCLDCRRGSEPTRASGAVNGGRTENPTSGVFTDGSSVPNPGPGGWGAVYVTENEVIAEAYGYGGDTTNNRMELLALIEAVDLVPPGVETFVFSDSNLAVRTINEWAEGWERRGWKRKTGPVENLDLVQRAYAAFRARPELKLRWIKAHVGVTWNEYADELANRGRVEGSE